MKPSPFLNANTPIKSRAYDEAGRANYDKIFRKGEETIEAMEEELTCEFGSRSNNPCKNKATLKRDATGSVWCNLHCPTPGETTELTLSTLNDCPECTGRGYHIVREEIENFGRFKYEAYRKGCTTCDGTGKVKG